MSNDLTLYSRAMCSWCIDAKDFLQARGYKFVEVDVGRNRAAYKEMKDLSDQSYVPTLVAGEEVLANFDVDQLEQFLDKHQIEPLCCSGFFSPSVLLFSVSPCVVIKLHSRKN